MPRISVIVPVYKAEDFLEKCVTSILNQTYTDLELILVDDGSPDYCPEICDKLAESDFRVKVIHQKNAGVAAARNAGLDIAQGEYITFVDSDDYIEPQMYDQMMKKVSEYDCDVVMCDCVKEFGNHSELYTHNIRSGFYNREKLENEYFPHLLITPEVEYPPTISNWLCLFRHSQANAELYYEKGIRYSEDLLFGAKMMYHAQSFYYMKGQAFYHYNCTNQLSATHTFAPDKWKDYQRLHRCICRDFGNSQIFDFSEQIDKVLLFFVYNAVGEALGSSALNKQERVQMAKAILADEEVRKMFQRCNVARLPVSTKLKILTLCYKYSLALGLLSAHLCGK